MHVHYSNTLINILRFFETHMLLNLLSANYGAKRLRRLGTTARPNMTSYTAVDRCSRHGSWGNSAVLVRGIPLMTQVSYFKNSKNTSQKSQIQCSIDLFPICRIVALEICIFEVFFCKRSIVAIAVCTHTCSVL